MLATKAVEPSSYSEALEGSERDHWQKAINEEYTSLQKNNTWVLTQLSPGHKAITCKWVFQLKINADSTKQYKAQLVIQGYEQCEGIDYEETFILVTMLKTIRVLL